VKAHDTALDTALGVEVWEPWVGVEVTEPGLDPYWLTVVEGVYTESGDEWPRATLEVTCPTSLRPAATRAPDPWGSVIRLYSGARVRGVLHSFQVATLHVDQATITRPEDELVIHAVSREACVNEDRITTRAATGAGTVGALVASLVHNTFPGLTVTNTLTTNPYLPAGAYPLDGDVWPTIVELMLEAGGEAVFAPDGTLILRDLPVKGTPVASLRVGSGGTLTGYNSVKRWAYNKVAIVYDDGTSRMVGLWEDTTSTSSTRVAGPYGRHTYVETVNVDTGHLPTLARANAAARALGRKAASPYRRVEVEGVPVPWIEPGDTVGITYLGDLTESVLVARNTWPLSQLNVGTITTADDAYTQGV
jgi:hypothetical protein